MENGKSHQCKDLVFQGRFVHSTSSESMLVEDNMVIGVRGGEIIFFDKADKLDEMLKKHEMDRENLVKMGEKQFLMPGFVDSHAHASQYSFMGTGNDLELLPWLEKYTYPTERSIGQDNCFANDVYQKCVRRTLMNGSTTVCYFATIDAQSTELLTDAVECQGQRAYIGKVNMDQNSPDTYRETREQSIHDTLTFVQDTLSRKNPLITPCITPRFAVSCTMELMKELSKIAKKYSLPVQTHVSENKSEVDFVSKLFPQTNSYTDVYNKAGLLTNKTVLAHGVHLSDEELDTIKEAGSGISHCPNSNFSLESGILDVRRIMAKGVKIGLGTDFAGGHSPSMLDAIRRGMSAANLTSCSMRKQGIQPVPVTYRDMFRLSTLGSAEVLGLDDTIGNFQVGKQFDALLISPEVNNSPFDVFPTDNEEDIVQKFIFLGDDRNISRVYVNGSLVITA